MSKKTPALNNPLAVASLATTALTQGDKIKTTVSNNWKLLLGLAVVGVGGFIVYKRLFNSAGNIEIKEDPRFPPSTLTDIEAKQVANTLFNAMNRLGTNNTQIVNALRGKDPNDFAKISEAFGTRYYQKQLGMEGGSLFDKKYGLFEWLSFELSNTEMAQLSAIIPNTITGGKTIGVGSVIEAKVNGVEAYNVEKRQGVYWKTSINKTYSKGDKIGTVLQLNVDPFTNEKHIIVDKNWSFDTLMIVRPEETVRAI